jgi:cytochrome c5
VKQLVLIMAFALAGGAVLAAEPAADDAAAKAILDRACVACHDLGKLTERRRAADEWPVIIDQMIGNGANLGPGEREMLIAYLTRTYSE